MLRIEHSDHLLGNTICDTLDSCESLSESKFLRESGSMSKEKDDQSVILPVRTLAEHVHRSGGLSSISFSGISGAEGTRLHQRVFSDLKKQFSPLLVETELTLASDYVAEDITLSVRGRADAVLHRQNGEQHEITVMEIKSCAGIFSKISDVLQPEHWAQAVLYAHLYFCANPELDRIFVSLRYVSIETLDYVEELRLIDRPAAKEFFDHTCEAYLSYARDIQEYKKKRDQSILSLAFPYVGIRSGQKDFMRAVLTTISQRGILFTEAPTGIGKTISALFPAIKSLPHKKSDKIFYLTAKTSTRGVAQKALADMQDKGLYLRSITLQSKESMCPVPQIYCETKQCPYADRYYLKLPAAIRELLQRTQIRPEDVIEQATKHKLCPHELSLDVSLLCDVIIGDYNHALNPRVKLDRYFNQPDQHHALLFDEAHNLVDRSRDMFTASLTESEMSACRLAIQGMDAKVDGYLTDISMYYRVLKDAIIKGDPGLQKVEESIDPKSVMAAGNYRASRGIPKLLYKMLWKFCFFVRPVLDSLPSGDIRRAALAFFFSARFFLSVLELYFDDAYVFSVEVGSSMGNGIAAKSDELVLQLLCLDASSKIHQLLKDRHATVFFSATLSPMTYYTSMLLGDKNASEATILRLHSPFPPENLTVKVMSSIRTTYKERDFTVERIVRTILEETSGKPGNFLVFLPSFAYLSKIVSALSARVIEGPATDILVQRPSMRATEKADYLARFNSFGERRLIAFAVLGGHFGEGIDLVGDRLSGVIVVGVGLPQVGPQKEIMRQYFQEKFGDGFGFAYRFPGWEKVLQASGRVIRDEEDTGFVLLLDERYKKPEYISLFPAHWSPIQVNDDGTQEPLSDYKTSEIDEFIDPQDSNFPDVF